MNRLEMEFICRDYEQAEIYTGMHGYHAHHCVHQNLPNRMPAHSHRIGIELEVEFNTGSDKDSFVEQPSNWFYRERDGSLGANGVEIITIPLLPKHAKSVEFWSSLTDTIKDVAHSWDTGRCGLHVHIGREILGRTPEQQSETLGRLLYLYHHFVKDTRMNVKIYGRERGYHDQDGSTDIGAASKLLGADVLKSKSITEKVKDSMINKNSTQRYFDINLTNPHTIEFRKGRGSINPKRIAMVVEYCEKLCNYAKSTPWPQIGYEDFVNYLKATAQDESLKRLVERYA